MLLEAASAVDSRAVTVRFRLHRRGSWRRCVEHIERSRGPRGQ